MIFPDFPVTKGSRAFIIVRNPYDIFMSFWQFFNTENHNLSMSNDFTTEFKEYWDLFLKGTVDSYPKFMDYWMSLIDTKKMPIFFIRFEDLVMD